MTLILIQLPNDYPVTTEHAATMIAAGLVDVGHLDGRPTITVDPSVYVVPGELSDEPAVFASEKDAEAFSETYTPPRGVFRLLICDAEVGAQMVADRLDDEEDAEQEACDSPCPHCGGATAETCNCMDETGSRGGSFTITLGGKTTGPIPCDATIAEIREIAEKAGITVQDIISAYPGSGAEA